MINRFIRLFAKEDFRRNPFKAIWRRLYWRFHWKFFPDRVFRVPFYGGLQIQLAPSSASLGIYLNEGFSDYSIAQKFIEYLKPGMVALDCGAHIGEYTLLFACLVGTEGQVHAFEPDPRVFVYLQRNVQFNKLSNVFINHVALSEDEGEEEFVLEKDPTASHISRLPASGLKAIRVKTTSIDAYVLKNGLRRLDAIKIDVEGAELVVIKGAMTSIEKFQPGLIFVEVEGESIDEVEYALRTLGYDVLIDEKGHKFPHIYATR